MPADPLSMQESILRLQNYWAEIGCVISQPFNTEVGAGTMNPATILSVLGPEPWRSAYVEPSVRPDDSRYGENPNRLQTHTQFQVILKPEPGNPQELYLRSLSVLGIDVNAHDVRFVEDNWAQPAIGAWGLGWEVWLDGLEITQFTYFQQVGGINLDPVPVEITYGLERILMAIQGVNHFKDILFAPGITYGEVFGQSEYEMSRYYLDEADVDATRVLLETYSNEASRLTELRLPVPAHVFVLKSSHAFNVLDARGAMSTTERAKWFATMRAQSRAVAELWTELRASAGHPRGTHTPLPLASAPDPVDDVAEGLLVFEILVEELPPHVVETVAAEVEQTLTELLANTALSHGRVHVTATPRRVVVRIEDIAQRESDRVDVKRGPKVASAFAADGAPTPALLGFLRTQSADVADLSRIDFNGTEHVALDVPQPGRPATAVLTELLSKLVAGLRSDKNMRWNDPVLTYSRPIRAMLALLGNTVLPVTAGALLAGRVTRGNRKQSHSASTTLTHAEEYAPLMQSEGILIDRLDRRIAVVALAEDLARQAGGVVDTDAEAELLDEITDLVESPVGILGRFDPKYLDLPDDVLTTVMRKHQRYLPVRTTTGELLPFFITMADGQCDHEIVGRGNETVVRARFEDAAFFWRADREIEPRELRRRLTALTFHERLGSVSDRADRIATLAKAFATRAELSSTEMENLAQASSLTKFDLASHLVVEFTSLAGIMAREYAMKAGESEEVAQALYEMELPRHHADHLPVSTIGKILALADRFDLLVGMLAVGAKLTGTSDPYGLRRAALGIVRILRTAPELAALTLPFGLETAAEHLRTSGCTVDIGVLTVASELLDARFAQRLRDEQVPAALISAVAPTATASPLRADRLRADIAESMTRHGQLFFDLVEALQRVIRILPPDAVRSYDVSILTTEAEVGLVNALAEVAQLPDVPLVDWTSRTPGLVAALQKFFDDVLVMADQPDLREARLGLLAAVLAAAPSGIDWQAVHLLRTDAE
ncbi:glycine--tRNA ligase [Mycobacterium sp. AZCC_0083]|uniref:glycine--tRNA ligase n=1 Tax=Mycobacterium sp. AZCC_0083 TaxID=2735882 RepID=UPI001618E01C|nr:glycine--tRNA ligase [Mycobacterium sp. AZCC_0083]MBB5163126.1 glycyl-tRNA synthetase [Mycobacterium sp. AZCC_0083]